MEYLKKFYKYRNLLSELVKRDIQAFYFGMFMERIKPFLLMMFSLIALALMLIITKIPITLVIFIFPLPLFYLLLICVGMGLILSVLAVYFRDIVYLYGVFLVALTYLTPIFYPILAIPNYALNILKMNTLFYILNMFRNITMYGNIPSLQDNFVFFVWGFVLIVIGLYIFRKKQDDFVLYM